LFCGQSISLRICLGSQAGLIFTSSTLILSISLLIFTSFALILSISFIISTSSALISLIFLSIFSLFLIFLLYSGVHFSKFCPSFLSFANSDLKSASVFFTVSLYILRASETALVLLFIPSGVLSFAYLIEASFAFIKFSLAFLTF